MAVSEFTSLNSHDVFQTLDVFASRDARVDSSATSTLKLDRGGTYVVVCNDNLGDVVWAESGSSANATWKNSVSGVSVYVSSRPGE